MINPAMVEFFEEIPRNLIGRDFADLVPRRYKQLVKEKLTREKENVTNETFEIEITIGGKKHKWLELKPTLISWYGESAYLVFVSNVSARKSNRKGVIHWAKVRRLVLGHSGLKSGSLV